MPILQVTGPLSHLTHAQLKELRSGLQHNVASVKALCLIPDQVTVQFPRDRMDELISDDPIIGKLWGLFVKPERTKEIHDEVSKSIALYLHLEFPQHKIEVLVEPFDTAVGSFACYEPQAVG